MYSRNSSGSKRKMPKSFIRDEDTHHSLPIPKRRKRLGSDNIEQVMVSVPAVSLQEIFDKLENLELALEDAKKERREQRNAIFNLAKDVVSLRKEIRTNNSTPNYFDLLPEFPITKTKNFLQFEEEVQLDDSVGDQLYQFLITLGGEDLTTFIKKAFKNIMIDEVGAKFSWLGMSDNIKIKDFKIISVFEEAALHKFPDTDFDDFESSIKRALTNTKDRISKSLKKGPALVRTENVWIDETNLIIPKIESD